MESRNHVKLRTFQEKDFAEVLRLFYDTVRNINSRDYTTEQISAWVLGVKEKRMKSALLAHTTLVATSNQKMVGFADMDETGYLDHLYVHHQHQSRESPRCFAICWKRKPHHLLFQCMHR